ncbi:Uncharacterised protein [BD1-7 clade bacterium]|uniref:Chromosome partition protein Smc n=1 Tax=BD1-7 clade bacterium TaxID=2029982 RepID=A0A5S9N6D9_9GAMM|nr:Uncharacterised protein [BD1-7 clade bacterium]
MIKHMLATAALAHLFTAPMAFAQDDEPEMVYLDDTILTTTLCSNVSTTIGIGMGTGVDVSADIDGGAGWGLGFVGKIIGSYTVGSSVAVSASNESNVEIEVCIEQEALIAMYLGDSLTPEQQTPVLMYLGETVFNNGESADDTIDGMLVASYVSGAQLRRAEAVFRPMGVLIDTQTRILSGEISLLDTLDETVFAIEGLAEAMPLDPTLAAKLTGFRHDISGKIADVQQGINGICEKIANVSGIGAAADAMLTTCDQVGKLQQGGEALQANMRKVVAFTGDIAGQIKQVDKVIDGATKTLETIDKKAASSFGKIDSVTRTVGGTTRDVVQLGTDVNGSLSALTTSIDGVVSTVNSSIGGIKDIVIKPLELAAKASKEVIDTVLTQLEKVNGVLLDLTSKLRS